MSLVQSVCMIQGMCVCAGGFFASGFKRALGVKDFGSSIPGHGGITDRFDCQMPMAVFAYLYYHFYIAQDTVSEEVFDSMMTLESQDKLRVFARLGGLLVGEGVLDRGALSHLLSGTGACASR